MKSPFTIIKEIIDSDDGFVRFHFSAHTKGALLYGVIPVCALYEIEHHGQLNVRAVLRHYVPNTGLHPLHRYAAIFLRQKA